MARNIALLVGSLRRESYTRKIANAFVEACGPALVFEEIEIGHLPFYNQDLETAEPPKEWRAFREKVRPLDGVLFATPEYNRSLPAVLKNALDVGSRPPPQSVWTGKPGAIISVSPGALGGFGANHHLRQSLVAVGISALGQPEAYIGNAAKLLDANGKLENESTREFLGKLAAAFTRWVEMHAAQR